MPRIQPINRDHADDRTRDVLDDVQKAFGGVPNLLKTMAQSPAVAEAYLGFAKALAGASLPLALREQIALTVANANGCAYCAAAHTMLGRKAGLDDDALAASLHALSDDSKTEGALQFAREIVTQRGWVSDDALARVREAGYGEGEIAEIVAVVAFNLFSNYFNHVADTDIDFPSVEIGEPGAACEAPQACAV